MNYRRGEQIKKRKKKVKKKSKKITTNKKMWEGKGVWDCGSLKDEISKSSLFLLNIYCFDQLFFFFL